MGKLKKIFLLPLLLLSVIVHAQTRTVKGKVMSAPDNKPVAGASVLIKGKTIGTATSSDGSFSLNVPTGNVILVVSFVGYTTVEQAVDDNTSDVTITLIESKGELGEVVVTALGITRQSKTLVYATQSVKPSELTGVRDPNNVLNSLQGKVANAIVTQGSGGPGSGAKIVLRGNRSIQGSNNALIVVDGIPINNPTYGTAGSDFGSVQGSDGASNINPDDIESITVLKGASAAALYGSQAGNGVIVITTKRGKKDRISVDINSGIAFENAWSLPNFQNTYGQGLGGQILEDATKGASWGAKMTGQSYTNHLGNQESYSPQPDNVKDFFRTATSLNNSIGISGGTDKMQTYFSYTNNDIQGIIPENDLMRHTINVRASNQISKKFSTDVKITYINQRINNKPRTGEENAPTIDIYQIPRSLSLDVAKDFEYTSNTGIPQPTVWPSTLSGIYQNPYWMINRTAINEKRDRIMGFISAKYQITDWLSITGRANLDRMSDRSEEIYYDGTTLWAASGTGGVYNTHNIVTTQQWYDAILEGNNNITKDIKINYHVGTIFQDVAYDQIDIGSGGLRIPNKFTLAFAKAPSLSPNSGGHQIQSVFGQTSISFKDAIFLDGSIRNDWDSRLPSPYSFQYYSGGVSVVLSDLVTLPTAISLLKLNANYAEVGNGGQEQVRNSTYNFSQGAGNGFLSRSSTFPIPDLKPEIVKNFEVGAEVRVFNNRFGLAVSYYNSKSSNQLLTISLPPATGYSSQYINAGEIENKGFEVILNATPIRSKDLTWDIALNFSSNRNKIIKLSDNLKSTPLGGGYQRSATPIVQEGGSYGDLYAYGWATNEKGQYIVTSSGTVGIPVASANRLLIGNFNPKELIGLTNTINFKRLSLRILTDGRVGGEIVSGTEMNLAFSGITEGTEAHRDGGWNLGGVDADGNAVSATISAQDFWTDPAVTGQRYGGGQFFTYDATSFRLREASLGYNFPIKENKYIKAATFSIVGRNLFWIYRGQSTLDIPGLEKRTMWFDPDMSLGNGNFQGTEYGTLPSTRTIGFNLKLTF